MKNKLLILALLLTLCGCWKQPKPVSQAYRQSMDAWIGKPRQELIATWGLPERQHDIGRRGQTIVYVAQHVVPRTDGFKPLYTRCEITFTAVRDRIRSWDYDGNDCDSAVPAPPVFADDAASEAAPSAEIEPLPVIPPQAVPVGTVDAEDLSEDKLTK